VKITEVRIKLMEDSSDRLRGFCSITFDDAFVIRDLKIIEGVNGPFVAMPSRKLTGHCGNCGCKNHLRASYCNQCGIKLKPLPIDRGPDQRAKLYADIAHPINSECREQIQSRVIDEYLSELEESQQPGYRSKYDDYFSDAGEDYEHHDDEPEGHEQPAHKSSESATQDQTEHQRRESSSKLQGPHSRKLDDKNKPATTAGKRNPKFGEGIFDE